MSKENEHPTDDDAVKGRTARPEAPESPGAAPALATPVEYFVVGLIVLAIGVAVFIALGAAF